MLSFGMYRQTLLLNQISYSDKIASKDTRCGIKAFFYIPTTNTNRKMDLLDQLKAVLWFQDTESSADLFKHLSAISQGFAAQRRVGAIQKLLSVLRGEFPVGSYPLTLHDCWVFLGHSDMGGSQRALRMAGKMHSVIHNDCGYWEGGSGEMVVSGTLFEMTLKDGRSKYCYQLWDLYMKLKDKYSEERRTNVSYISPPAMSVPEAPPMSQQQLASSDNPVPNLFSVVSLTISDCCRKPFRSFSCARYSRCAVCLGKKGNCW